MHDALKRDLEAARYATDRAFWQYDAAASANRLVAGELEARCGGRKRNRSPQCCRGRTCHRSGIARDTRGGSQDHLERPFDRCTAEERIVRIVIHELIADVDTEGG